MARYKVRMDEIEQSLRILEQALDYLPKGPVMAAKVPKTIKPPKGDYYHAVETARGLLGIPRRQRWQRYPLAAQVAHPLFFKPACFWRGGQGNAAARCTGAARQP